ncbi:MAG: zinc ribbon domain-containing protein [Oceanospirillaceae bacterium]
MPIFDYACGQCGHFFEKLVMKSDAPAPNCIACDSDQVTKQMSAPAFRLAGSGWYETDFKTGKKKNLAGADEKTNAPAKTAEKPAD